MQHPSQDNAVHATAGSTGSSKLKLSLLTVALSCLLTACGSGGGGGGGASSFIPGPGGGGGGGGGGTSPVTPPPPDGGDGGSGDGSGGSGTGGPFRPTEIPNVSNVSQASWRSANPRSLPYLGIIDSAFTAGSGLTNVGGASPGNYSSHGSIVFSTLYDNLSPELKSGGVKMRGYTAGNAANATRISVSLDYFKDAYNNGARVFNNSWGGSPNSASAQGNVTAETRVVTGLPSNPDSIKDNSLVAGIWDLAANKDSIIVFAAGNDNLKEADAYAQIPTAAGYEKARKGWLAATALNGEHGAIAGNGQGNASPVQYANYIGNDAMLWGIAANGNASSEVGTSFAAPRVSATAMNVWYKYPWMSNHLVTMSILTTADKMSGGKKDSGITTGPDNITGWGALNNSRAMNGPAMLHNDLIGQFAVESGRLTDDGYTGSAKFVEVNVKDVVDYRLNDSNYTWSNNITGPGGIYKTGPKPLILTGNNNFSGGIVVHQGQMHLRGNNTAPIYNGTGGELVLGKYNPATSGTTDQITLAAISSKGKTSVVGPVQAGAVKMSGSSAKLQIDLIDGYLSASSVNLDASNNKVYLYSYQATNLGTVGSSVTRDVIKPGSGNYQGAYDASAAFGSISGLQINNGTSSTGTLQNSNGTYQVTYQIPTRTKAVRSMGLANEQTLSTAASLDGLIAGLQNTQSQQQAAIAAGAGNSAARSADGAQAVAAVSAAGDSGVAPEQTEVYSSPAYQAALKLVNTPAADFARVMDSLSGEIHASSQNIIARQAQVVNRTVAERMAAVRMLGMDGFYGDAGYNDIELCQDGFAGTDTSIYTAHVGFDRRIGDNYMIGAALAQSHAKTTFGELGGRTEIDLSNVSFYGSYRQDWFYVASRLGASYIDSDIRRDVMDAQVHSDHTDWYANWYNEAGMQLEFGSVRFNPYLGLDINRFHRGSFAEKEYALGIEDSAEDYNGLDLYIGARMAMQMSSWLQLTAELEHMTALKDVSYDFDGSYLNTGINAHINGIERSDNLTSAALGLWATFGNFTWGTRLRSGFADASDLEDLSWNVSMNYQF
ncbi:MULTISPECIES: autotransporter domain-containing protein [unclassified Anaerobiospirillum]|uniref:autotransporter domain-containing protein n=1 Tax=unclassified Anaerobiospirillum TaxID=2647410 RepID=UPI001FF2F701|nr:MULTISPECIES: autotransporter domain-containing protein [unclassified Anaerobiospirillum]MCK0533713.1 autotransporter domain-containing protein [Anaerobiospirillum sp. NML120511]MCK0540043.1 autotransporter domain-containing protein [Anaerobiospirillum sp. NML02-A-032]